MHQSQDYIRDMGITSSNIITGKLNKNIASSRNRSGAFSIAPSVTNTFSAFNDAQLEILKLMERDTYARFLKIETLQETIRTGLFRSKSIIHKSINDYKGSRDQIDKVTNYLKDIRKYKVSAPAGFYGIKDEEFETIGNVSQASNTGDYNSGW